MSITLQPGEIKRVDVVMTPLTTGWLSPVNYHDPDKAWSFEGKAYDGNLNTEAYTETSNAWLMLFTQGTPLVSKVRVYCGTDVDGNYNYVDAIITVQVYDDDLEAYVPVFSGVVRKLQWVELPLDKTRPVGDIRIKWNSIPPDGYGCLRELQYRVEEG